MNSVAFENIQNNCHAMSSFFMNHFCKNPVHLADELIEMIEALTSKVKAAAEGVTYDSIMENAKEFRSWVNNHENAQLKDHLEVFLVKIPLKSALNLLDTFKEVISLAVEVASDPSKGLEKLSLLLHNLLVELITPDTWPTLAMGFVGAHFGEVAILGAPLSIYALIVAAAIGLAGISLDLLMTDFAAKTESLGQAITNKLHGYGYRLPEAFFTGFFFSSLFGAIRRAYDGVPQKPDFYIQNKSPRPTCIDFPMELVLEPQHKVLNGFSVISALAATNRQSA